MRTLTKLQERLHRDMEIPEDWACIAQSLGLGDLRPEQRDALWRRFRSIFRVYLNPNELPDLRRTNYTRVGPAKGGR